MFFAARIRVEFSRITVAISYKNFFFIGSSETISRYAGELRLLIDQGYRLSPCNSEISKYSNYEIAPNNENRMNEKISRFGKIEI